MVKSTFPTLAMLKALANFSIRSAKRQLRIREKRVALPEFGDPIIAPGGDECQHYNGYASAQDNEFGLQARFHHDTRHGGSAFRWQSRPVFESYPTVIHGGVIFSLLDEALGHAVYAQCRTFGLTIGTTTTWYRVIKSGTTITGRAKVVRRFWRLLAVEGYVFNEKGKVAASCMGIFFIPSRAQFRRVIDVASLPAQTAEFCGRDESF